MKKSFYMLLLLITLSPLMVLAQGSIYGANNSTQYGAGNTPTQYGGCNSFQNGSFTLCNPLAVSNFCDLVKALLNIVMAIGIPIAVLFLVWSGFRFILARGSQTGLQDAKRNFMYVIIGIAVFLGAWTLATVISATIKTLDSSGTIQLCGR